MTLAVEVTQLSIYADEQCLVDRLSLQIRLGQPVTILGETGSGKSLLAHAIAGILPSGLRQEGHVTLFGRSQDALSQSELEAMWGKALAVLPQEPWLALNPIRAIDGQISEVGECVLQEPSTHSQGNAQRQLDRLGLGEDGNKIPAWLSGGMAQRAAYAAATYAGAPLLIADEPSKGLDEARRDQIGALLVQHAQCHALLTITHDIELARQIGGEIIVMRQGQILERGDAEQILNQPRSDYAKALIAAHPSQWPQATKHRQTTPVLSANALSHRRGGRLLFNQLDIQLHQGEIVGLSGDSGSGKSTLADILLGLLSPDSGKIANPLPRGQALKLYQDPPAAFAQHVSMGALLQDLIRLHKLDANQIPALMNQLNLAPALLQRPARAISGGELQRFALLRALLMKPRFLVADEPTSRLDPITAAQITQLLVKYAREHDAALLFISHERTALERICDRIISL
ncbi:ABC transporter ATP-binding protein [Ferrimonas pelagia]|uniref:ABC transporter ATP-binding protein n=1 Tax=Ferrimonas pelagia TaxID=1177826 RepID=A0ABP9EFR2_9GAMM